VVKNKTVGLVRYFTYFLRFPDGEEWVDQIPFVHDLEWELSQTVFGLEPFRKKDLMTKGETHWKDNNSVEHQVVIEEKERPRRWGKVLPKLGKGPNRQARRFALKNGILNLKRN
jgi:hypothetical protein